MRPGWRLTALVSLAAACDPTAKPPSEADTDGTTGAPPPVSSGDLPASSSGSRGDTPGPDDGDEQGGSDDSTGAYPVDPEPEAYPPLPWVNPLGEDTELQADRILTTGGTWTDLPRWHDGVLYFTLDKARPARLIDGEAVELFDDGLVRQCRAIDPITDRMHCLHLEADPPTWWALDATSETLAATFDALPVPGLANDQSYGPSFAFFSNRCDGHATCSGAPDGVRGGVYRLSLDGQLTDLRPDVQNPNGLIVTPDGKTLFIAASAYKDQDEAGLYRLDIDAEGNLGPAERVTHVDKPDGVTIDLHGNAYVCSSNSRVAVYRLDTGEMLGRIRARSRVTNVAFGGPTDSTLFMTTSQQGVYAIDLPVTGYVP
ncbi:MAG: SMP-30/gluconolactonase/LRE family protein [Myxococcota bacterium]